nr:hypothetical protein YSBCXYJI_YSBCXYJI_CDS_0033 [Caudoviricetes sp.]DAI22708.1 MAG TPA: hypothetical protein [Caudoviricetes sp.]
MLLGINHHSSPSKTTQKHLTPGSDSRQRATNTLSLVGYTANKYCKYSDRHFI